MASYQLIDDLAVVEPITLEEQKAYSRIDADYAEDDTDLNVCISASRQRMESFLNVGLVNRDVSVKWYGQPIVLPLYPTGNILTVNDGVGDLTSDKYTLLGLGAKTIYINDVVLANASFMYGFTGGVSIFNGSSVEGTIYTVNYNTGYETLPNALKLALMAETDYLFKLKGQPILGQLSPNALKLAHPYSNNLILA